MRFLKNSSLLHYERGDHASGTLAISDQMNSKRRTENQLDAAVESSWFSSLRLYYNARTNIHQIQMNTVSRLLGLRHFDTRRHEVSGVFIGWSPQYTRYIRGFMM